MTTDPRGPIRRIAAIEQHPEGGTGLRLDCGHLAHVASHFAYRVGDECRCYRCGKDGAR